tara:strand:- start:42 stop:431 length:390 start_codon:yes stop_codon:yes gene_type:complete
MKNRIFLILCLIIFIACKSDKKEGKTETVKEASEYKTLKGNYLYYTNTAILQTPTRVYGVILDENSKELNNKVAPFKVLDTDMVPVEIKGEVIAKDEGEEGWPFKVKIVEILNVIKPLPENKDIITLGK